jgi:hypothetical protein
MATELQHEQRELAEYIRAGSTRGPQCFGSYFDEKGGSCALGAVYEGVYHLPREHGKLIPDHLERLFRCLDEMTKKCPQGCSKRLPLASMIVHLNDDHRLSREQIAEWLIQNRAVNRVPIPGRITGTVIRPSIGTQGSRCLSSTDSNPSPNGSTDPAIRAAAVSEIPDDRRTRARSRAGGSDGMFALTQPSTA